MDVEQPEQAQQYQQYSQMLLGAVKAYNSTDASVNYGESGKSRWLLVQPWEVCESLSPDQPEIASNGVFFPHPLTSFGRSIEIYRLAVNGATAAVGTMVALLARKAIKAQMTAPVERVSMHVLAP